MFNQLNLFFASTLIFYKLPLLCETLTGEALTHVERHKKKKFKDKVKSELRTEVSKAFIIVRFGLGPSKQVNSTTGLTLCLVATMACTA